MIKASLYNWWDKGNAQISESWWRSSSEALLSLAEFLGSSSWRMEGSQIKNFVGLTFALPCGYCSPSPLLQAQLHLLSAPSVPGHEAASTGGKSTFRVIWGQIAPSMHLNMPRCHTFLLIIPTSLICSSWYLYICNICKPRYEYREQQ